MGRPPSWLEARARLDWRPPRRPRPRRAMMGSRRFPAGRLSEACVDNPRINGRPRGAGYRNHPYPLYMQRQRGILKSRTTSGMGRSSALKKKTIGSVVWAIRTWRNLR
jgi:hypothetical protein